MASAEESMKEIDEALRSRIGQRSSSASSAKASDSARMRDDGMTADEMSGAV